MSASNHAVIDPPPLAVSLPPSLEGCVGDTGVNVLDQGDSGQSRLELGRRRRGKEDKGSPTRSLAVFPLNLISFTLIEDRDS